LGEQGDSTSTMASGGGASPMAKARLTCHPAVGDSAR
jgi:hypothetical protein